MQYWALVWNMKPLHPPSGKPPRQYHEERRGREVWLTEADWLLMRSFRNGSASSAWNADLTMICTLLLRAAWSEMGATQLRSRLRRELLEAHIPLSADNRAALRRSNLKQLAVLTDAVSDICMYIRILVVLYNPSTRAHFNLTNYLGHWKKSRKRCIRIIIAARRGSLWSSLCDKRLQTV